MNLNKEFEDVNNWRYTDLDELTNDLMSELGEISSDVKTYEGRGTNRKNKTVPTILTFGEEFFDLYVYMVLGLESLNVDEKLFNDIAIMKLAKIRKRLEDIRNG